MRKNKILALLFIFLVVLSLTPFAITKAKTAYPTDGKDGSTQTPTLDPFSDYSFDETYPQSDVRNPFYPTSYNFNTHGTLYSAGLNDLLASDDVRMILQAWEYYESIPDANYRKIECEYIIPIPSGYSDSVYLVFEGYFTAGTGFSGSIQIQVWSGSSWTAVDGIPSSETSKKYSVSSSYIISSQVKIRIYMSLTKTGSGYDATDAYVYLDRLYLRGNWNGVETTVYAEDFIDSDMWEFQKTNLLTYQLELGSVYSDGDCLYVTRNTKWFYTEFNFEGVKDEVDDMPDVETIGWNETDTIGDINYDSSVSYGDSYGSVKIEYDSGSTSVVELSKSDFPPLTEDVRIVVMLKPYDPDDDADGISFGVRDSDGDRLFYMLIKEGVFRIYYDSGWHSFAFADGTWYETNLYLHWSSKTYDITVKSSGGTIMQYTGKSFYTFDGTINNIAEVYFKGFGAALGDETLHIDNFWMACASNTDWYDSSIDVWYAQASIVPVDTNTVPFVELQAYNGTIALSDSSNNWLSNAISDSNVHIYNARSATSSISALRVWLDGLSMCDYIRFYSIKDYSYSNAYADLDDIIEKDTYLKFTIDFDSANSEWFGIDYDVTDFSTDTYQYFTIEWNVSSTSDVFGYVKISYNDSTYDLFNCSSTSMTRETFELDSGLKVTEIRIAINDLNDALASGTYYLWVNYITFSVAEIDVDSITVNYEDTYLSPDQTIEITSITAKWADGTAINNNNFKVNLIENSSTVSFNTSAPMSRSIQLGNSTYTIGVQWCNDTRYRFWVVGSNYTFWIIGTSISTDFDYTWKITSTLNYLGTFTQIQQLTFNNGSVVSNQPAMYWYVNGTSVGYEICTTSGWLPNYLYYISQPSDSTWINVYVNITNGDFWQVIYNETMDVSSLASADAWVRLGFHTPSGQVIPFETFRVKIHHDFDDREEWLYDNTFVMNKYSTVDIYVYDVYDQLVVTRFDVPWSYYLDYEITVYSYKLFNQQSDFVYVTLQRQGTSQKWSKWLAPSEVTEFFVVPDTYALSLQYPNGTVKNYLGIPITSDYMFRITGKTFEDVIQGQIEVQSTINIVQILSVVATIGTIIVSTYTIYKKIVKPYAPKVKKYLETTSLQDIIARKKKTSPHREVEEKRRRAEERRRNA